MMLQGQVNNVLHFAGTGRLPVPQTVRQPLMRLYSLQQRRPSAVFSHVQNYIKGKQRNNDLFECGRKVFILRQGP